jgi:site-specific DNA-methyltransferase (adenine-specific)
MEEDKISKITHTSVDINDWIKDLEEKNKKVDLWITDPPYPFDNKNGSGRFSYQEGEDNMYPRLTWQDFGKIYKSFYDLTPVGGRAYVFASKDGLVKTQSLLEKAGWTFKNYVVWDKELFGGGYHWRNSVEFIIYVTKGDPKVQVKKARNMLRYKKPSYKNSVEEIGYIVRGQSPKPREIWNDIMKYGMAQDDVCADPFAGTNPLRAAALLNPDIYAAGKEFLTNTFGDESLGDDKDGE